MARGTKLEPVPRSPLPWPVQVSMVTWQQVAVKSLDPGNQTSPDPALCPPTAHVNLADLTPSSVPVSRL